MQHTTRRKFLAGTTGTLAATTGCIDQARSFATGGYPGFESIDWINLDVLRITFAEDHTMDGFGIAHEHTDDVNNFLYLCKAPQFSGPVHLPLIDKINQTDTVYPSRAFKAVAYKGTFRDCGGAGVSLVQETLGSQPFEIPASIMPRDNWQQ